MRPILLSIALTACFGSGTDPTPDDLDVGDSGIDEPPDSGDSPVDPPADSGATTDTFAGDSGADTDTDTDTDTDPPDTDPKPVSYTITGKALCVDGVDDSGNVLHGDAAQPRSIRVLPGPGISCRPLGGGCTHTGNVGSFLAKADVASDGSFTLTFEAFTLDELYLFSDTTDGKGVGNCGSGYQFTEQPLTELQQTQGFTDVTVSVYSVFY